MNRGRADVCLILEGTYPYVTGGVSAWVHQLVKALPDIAFGLVTIVPSNQLYTQFKYVLPDNITWIQKICIHEKNLSNKCRRASDRNKSLALDELRLFYDNLKSARITNFNRIFELFINEETRVFAPSEFLFEKTLWKFITDRYEKSASEISFLDYFWNFRFIHLPVLNLISGFIPEAGLYHSVSTGYAGLFSAICRLKWNSPSMITEHGIYTRERRIEIDQADWISDQTVNRPHIASETSAIRKMWNTLFAAMSLTAYS